VEVLHLLLQLVQAAKLLLHCRVMLLPLDACPNP
jgi:hypothetical protein